MSYTFIPTRFQWRMDTAANWAANNPIPLKGEPCLETDTGCFKVGDGLTAYNTLLYSGAGLFDLSALADGYVPAWDAANSKFVMVPQSGGGGGGGYAEGTSNPGSPTTDQKFYRTDLNLLIYYDGTRWLTVQEYALPMGGAMDNLGNTTATLNTQARWPVRSDYGLYLTRWAATTLIVTTNTGSAFWTVALRWTNAANTQTTLVSFNTSADAPTNWIHHDQTINAVLDATAVQIQTTATKTGAPGGIYCTSQLFGRLIVV